MARKRRRRGKSGGAEGEEPEELKKAPHTFVIKKGKVDKKLTEVMMDMRNVMEPFTAKNLKVQKQNVMRDFVGVASLLNVTHMLMFTMTEKGSYLRLCRFPKGPTLTYRIKEYVLARDVRSSLRKPLVHGALFQTSPLIVMNSFSSTNDTSTSESGLEVKLQSSMWKNLFPTIDMNSIDLNDIRRCVLLNYNSESKEIDFRHYAVRIKPVGLSRPIRKLVTSKKVPDLGRLRDIQELMDRNDMTESEGEAADDADETRHVTIPQEMKSRGNLLNEKSAIRLIEIGPRFTLELLKVEEGLMEGDVLYHAIFKKSAKEIKELKEKKELKLRLKESRKKQQDSNVERKQKLLEEKLEKRKMRQSIKTSAAEDMIEDEDVDEDFPDEDADVHSKDVMKTNKKENDYHSGDDSEGVDDDEELEDDESGDQDEDESVDAHDSKRLDTMKQPSKRSSGDVQQYQKHHRNRKHHLKASNDTTHHPNDSSKKNKSGNMKRRHPNDQKQHSGKKKRK